MSISPNVPTPQESYHYENTGTPRWIAVLFGVLIVAVLGLGYLGHSAQSQLHLRVVLRPGSILNASLSFPSGLFCFVSRKVCGTVPECEKGMQVFLGIYMPYPHYVRHLTISVRLPFLR